MWIDIVVILCIILVTGCGHKQRIEVEHFHTKFFQIIHFGQYTCQITTIEVCHVEIFRTFIPVFYLLCLTVDVIIFTGFHVIGGISVTEAIGKNLIHNRTFCPLRRRKSRNDAKLVLWSEISGYTCPVIGTAQHTGYDFKMIFVLFLTDTDFRLIIVKITITICQIHFNVLIFMAEHHQVLIIGSGPETNFHGVTCLWFRRHPVICCSIRE